jgi:hypothetical protein
MFSYHSSDCPGVARRDRSLLPFAGNQCPWEDSNLHTPPSESGASTSWTTRARRNDRAEGRGVAPQPRAGPVCFRDSSSALVWFTFQISPGGPGRIRTFTLPLLRRVPLPLGYEPARDRSARGIRSMPAGGVEPPHDRSLAPAPLPVGLRGPYIGTAGEIRTPIVRVWNPRHCRYATAAQWTRHDLHAQPADDRSAALLVELQSFPISSGSGRGRTSSPRGKSPLLCH